MIFRDNIFLSVEKRLPSTGGVHTVEDSYEDVLHPIFSKLARDATAFPRTLVYVPIKWSGFLHEMAVHVYGVKEDLIHPHMVQYHAPQTAEVSIS